MLKSKKGHVCSAFDIYNIYNLKKKIIFAIKNTDNIPPGRNFANKFDNWQFFKIYFQSNQSYQVVYAPDHVRESKNRFSRGSMAAGERLSPWLFSFHAIFYTRTFMRDNSIPAVKNGRYEVN